MVLFFLVATILPPSPSHRERSYSTNLPPPSNMASWLADSWFICRAAVAQTEGGPSGSASAQAGSQFLRRGHPHRARPQSPTEARAGGDPTGIRSAPGNGHRREAEAEPRSAWEGGLAVAAAGPSSGLVEGSGGLTHADILQRVCAQLDLASPKELIPFSIRISNLLAFGTPQAPCRDSGSLLG